METNGFRKFLCSGLGRLCMIVVFYAIIFGLMLASATWFENSTFIPVVMAFIFACWGWKSLNKIQPSIFLIMPIGGWLIYLFVKGCLSLVIGMFVAPFVLSKTISEAVQDTLSQ